MAKQIEGVYERILECAKQEFLEKGYLDASLRTIATKAGTSTNSIYVRFQDKEGLFEALVGEQYAYFMNCFRKAQADFAGLPPESQPEHLSSISGWCMMEMLLYAYKHLDEFQLILTCSKGTCFSGMIDEMVEIEVKGTHDYLAVLKNLGRPAPPIDPKLEHILITGMFNAYFELIIHEMPLEQAKAYPEELRAFYTAGWMKIMGQ